MSKSLEILKKYKTTQFVISEICVDESKAHLTSEFAIEKIRSCLSKNNVSIEEYKQLEQDLERKEQLEIADRNNQNLVKTNVDLVNKNLELQKENQELIVNKNVAQAVALNQKREIAELKDQVAYLKEDSKEWQSAYEWSQAQNSILKLKNQELKEQLKLSNESQETVINTMTLVSQENEKLKKSIEILSNYICVRNPLDEEDTYYLSALFSNEEIDKQTHDLLKEVLEDE